MKILHVISSVNPKGGGPIEVVNQLSKVHREMGITVEICSLDDPTSDFVRNSITKVHAIGPVLGSYKFTNKLVPWLKSHAHRYNAVIVNGIWQYTSFAVWRALVDSSIPYFVFPHGMLGPWFKHTYPLKHLKKWFYWHLAEYRVLRDARKVVFTCEEERLLARNSFWLYSVNESVVISGIASPLIDENMIASRFISKYMNLQNKRIVLFLGRLHKVKGCDLLIEAFSTICTKDENLHLVIAGPDQIGWTSKLKTKASNLGILERITFTGMLSGDMKWGAIYASEVLCLPSHHENFGIVVVEALACGKPVLITNKVNIWHEIQEDGAGLVAEDTYDGIVENFNCWLSMTASEFDSMKIKSKACFESRFNVDRSAKRLIEVIKESAH